LADVDEAPVISIEQPCFLVGLSSLHSMKITPDSFQISHFLLIRFLAIFQEFNDVHGTILRLERVCDELAIDNEVVIVLSFHDILSLNHIMFVLLNHGLKRPIIQITAK